MSGPQSMEEEHCSLLEKEEVRRATLNSDATDHNVEISTKEEVDPETYKEEKLEEPTQSSFTVDEALDHMEFGWFQWLLMFYVGLAWMSDALEMMLLSFLSPALRCIWDLSPAQEAALTQVVFVGMLFGATAWGWLADIKGRRLGFLFPGLFLCAAGLASALAPNFTALLICRGAVGFGLGGCPVAFNLFVEFLPSKGRGHFLVLFESFWALGAAAEAALAWATLERLGWRWLIGLSAVPLVLLMLLFPLLPESPHFLLLKGDVHKAQRTLEKVARWNGRPLPPGNLQPLPLPAHPHNTPLYSGPDSSDFPVRAEDDDDEKKSPLAAVAPLFSPTLRRTTLLLWLLFFCVACIYYGVVLLSTEVTVQDSKECDGNGGATFSNQDFADVLITTLAEVPGLVFAAILVDRIGRLNSLLVSSILCAVCMGLLLLGLDQNLTTGFLFGARASIMTAFTVIFIYAAEVFPTNVRALAVGIANTMARFGGILAPTVAVALVEEGSIRAAESIFLMLCLVTALAILFLPIETKDRPLQDSEIEIELTTIDI